MFRPACAHLFPQHNAQVAVAHLNGINAVGEVLPKAGVAAKDLDIVMPRTRRNDVRMSVSYQAPLAAPVKKGTVVGKLKVEIPDQAPMEVDLMAANDVPRLGAFGRAKARAKYLLSGVTE